MHVVLLHSVKKNCCGLVITCILIVAIRVPSPYICPCVYVTFREIDYSVLPRIVKGHGAA